jgi:hypothetical protein
MEHEQRQGPEPRVLVEEWPAQYCSPMLADEPAADGLVELTDEDGGERFAIRPPDVDADRPIAFIDGIRRGDAHLYLHDPASGRLARGIAGCHARGAVLRDRTGIRTAHVEVTRLAIWGSGAQHDLPPAPGGFAWRSVSVHDSDPDAPLRELQNRMRESEGRLAEQLAAEGRLVVCDGPMTYVRSRDLPVCGYVKTHLRMLLEPEHHAKVSLLRGGERTPLFRLGRDRYSCYVRLCDPGPHTSPWHGIARLEVPQSAGFAAARAVVDELASLLPRFAGVAHCDPRAPVNLQPIGALERELRHRLGDGGLAARAVRESARALAGAAPAPSLRQEGRA